MHMRIRHTTGATSVDAVPYQLTARSRRKAEASVAYLRGDIALYVRLAEHPGGSAVAPSPPAR